MKNKKPLYIHLHIPKTAGYTFRYHITKNLRKDEQIFLCYEFLGLDLFNPPLKYEVYKDRAFRLIKKLGCKERDKVKIIHGHTVPYGIHELFEDRDIRYFTFVRNPVERALSIYTYLSKEWSKEGHIKRMKNYYSKYLLYNGKLQTFDSWLKNTYVSDRNFSHFSMAGYLSEFGYLRGKLTTNNISKALKKFFFVGITEKFDSESLFFFNELNMHKFFIDQNISSGKTKELLVINLKKEILKRSMLDSFLYKNAIKTNSDFKKENPEFEKVVRLKYLERKLVLPITQLAFAPRQTALRVLNNLTSGQPLRSNSSFFSTNK